MASKETSKEISKEKSKESLIRLVKKAPEKIASHLVLVPQGAVVIALISLALLFVLLISAVVIVDLAPQPAAFNESCASRSCKKEFDMKCIEGFCTCPSDQYFVTKCISKKSFLETCASNGECNRLLYCIQGKC